MQVSRNYRSNKAFIQLRPVSLGLILCLQISFLWLAGCSPKTDSIKQVDSILPTVDAATLPDAIKSLLAQSDTQYFNNNLTGSLATLERALRINPRYAEVWSRMAQVYLKQGKVEQAIQHAKRSNSVITGNVPLREFNDQIIAAGSGSNSDMQEQTR